jgi:hypothetical protein
LLDVSCPQCGSKHIRASKQLSAVERLAELFGVVHLRCRECDERFTAGLLEFRNWVYARCPLCYRLNLTGWRLEKYIVPRRWKILLALGAKARRCDSCRCNFVSFRPVKRATKRPRAVGPAGSVAS